MNGNLRSLARGALLAALAVLLQSLRLFLPLPLTLSTFIIGTLVHMMLALACCAAGLRAALLLSLLLPLTAYLQGQLALPFLLPVVMLGNALFCWLYVRGEAAADRWENRLAAGAALCLLPPLAKACCMYAAAWLALATAGVEQAPLRNMVLFGMSVPQFVTGVAGVWLAGRLRRFLRDRDL